MSRLIVSPILTANFVNPSIGVELRSSYLSSMTSREFRSHGTIFMCWQVSFIWARCRKADTTFRPCIPLWVCSRLTTESSLTRSTWMRMLPKRATCYGWRRSLAFAPIDGDNPFAGQSQDLRRTTRIRHRCISMICSEQLLTDELRIWARCSRNVRCDNTLQPTTGRSTSADLEMKYSNNY